jgi:DNA-binding response OmpR family regulator
MSAGDLTKTVLNVDDHAPARFVRTRILQRAGFGVDEVDNAAEAIAHASTASLMLLDVKLPDSDGFTVCEQVKKISPTLPIVMVTSVYRTAQARRDAFAVGADAFLLEPLAPEQLVRTVESLLNRKDETPRPAISDAWVITDAVGHIEEISADAARVLNLSQRGARGRNLATFFVENRPKLMAELLRAADGVIIEHMGTLQPRDRKPLRVHIDVTAMPRNLGERVALRWLIAPETR